jgi:hypothetical protein
VSGEKQFLHLHWKKIFSKTNMPLSIKLDANYPCIKAIQVCLDKGTDPHKGEIITKNANI